MNKLIQTNPFRLSPTALIILIILVGGLLFFQVMGDGFQTGSQIPSDRETCLSRGYIWSQSAGKCYETGNAAARTVASATNFSS